MLKTTFDVSGMHCASCANTIEKKVKGLSGVSACQVNFGTNKMSVDYDPKKVSSTQIRDTVTKAGYKLG